MIFESIDALADLNISSNLVVTSIYTTCFLASFNIAEKEKKRMSVICNLFLDLGLKREITVCKILLPIFLQLVYS